MPCWMGGKIIRDRVINDNIKEKDRDSWGRYSSMVT